MPSKEMNDQETTLDTLGKEITTAAGNVARDWPGVAEAEDIEQEIWLRLLESENSIHVIQGFDPQRRSRFLHRCGHIVASSYRNEYDVFTGNFYYSTDEVRSILRKDRTEEDHSPMWELMNDPDLTPKHPAASPEETPGSETLTEQIDLSEGMTALREKNSWLASLVEGQFFEGVPRHSHSRYLTRAVDALTRCMNSVNRNRQTRYWRTH